MNVIDLVRSKGIDPRRASASKGGEYHSACPVCGDGGKGKDSDRFHVWPEQNAGAGSWWCRSCSRGGDAIALVMAMDGIGYKQACAQLGIDVPESAYIPVKPRPSRRGNQKPAAPVAGNYAAPQDKWRAHALKFARWAHEQLIEKHPEQINYLSGRGIDPSTALRWNLGWNPGDKDKDLFRDREAWGLEAELKEDGKKKKLWIPRGLVIPYYRDGELQRIRIRRPKEHLRSESDPRYYVLPGSSAMPWIIGTDRRAYVVVETELDALMIDETVCDLAGVLAMGSASNMPDPYCHDHLSRALVILNALDYDQAGSSAWPKWHALYPQARRWPVPVGKDPGDAYSAGVDIAAWVLAGLPPAWHVGLSPFAAKTLQGVAVTSQQKEIKQDPAAKQPQKPQTAMAASVQELGDMLRRYPVRIVNAVDRTGIETPQAFSNDAVCRRISELVFIDPDCVAYLAAHCEDLIDGKNFYTGRTAGR